MESLHLLPLYTTSLHRCGSNCVFLCAQYSGSSVFVPGGLSDGMGRYVVLSIVLSRFMCLLGKSIDAVGREERYRPRRDLGKVKFDTTAHDRLQFLE